MTKQREYVQRWLKVRVLFESPILDERKWAKIPTIPADAFILDLEDSVPGDRKLEARAKVIEYLRQPDYFGDAMNIPRTNGLDTPWGRDDIIALAEAGIEQLMYPKAETVDELHEVLELCRSHGSDPVLRVGIESARGVVEVERIAAMEEVVCVGCGIGDLHVDTGQPLYDESGALHPVHHYPKLRTVMAAVAFGKARLGFPQLPDLRDVEEYRRRAALEKDFGFTGCSAFYPPQVPILLEVFTPTPAEIAHAHEVIGIYEQARADGRNAAMTKDGTAILIHQYKRAKHLLERLE